MEEYRVIEEGPRGCGYRKDGGAYLVGELDVLGALPPCVLVDPPVPVDSEIIPHTRGVYLVAFDAVVLGEPCDEWLIGSSKASLRDRERKAWEYERYGMTLDARLKTGVCAGMDPARGEAALASLSPFGDVYLADYILAISRAGKGRKVAREVGVMQQARKDKDYPTLLASCWRLSGYNGSGASDVEKNCKRIMVGIRAMGDALAFGG
jgi:hypothetical protein